MRDRITSEGIEAAYEALVAVCSDKQAPAQARATASTTLFRAAGLLERYEEPAEKELHEMFRAELNELVRKGEAVINAQYEAMMAARSETEQNDDESFLKRAKPILLVQRCPALSDRVRRCPSYIY